jgi:hypothetical protein
MSMGVVCTTVRLFFFISLLLHPTAANMAPPMVVGDSNVTGGL